MARKKNAQNKPRKWQKEDCNDWASITSREAILRARATYKPMDFLVRDNPELSELIVEVNEEAVIAPQSHRKLVEAAQIILGGNIKSRRDAAGSEDVKWVEGQWNHPEGRELLDPTKKFKVGVMIPKHFLSVGECEKAAKFLKLSGEMPEGLSMIPNGEGRHIKVPLLGILLRSNLVEVFRGEERLGTCSIWSALIGFEEYLKKIFKQPTVAEALELELREKRERKAERIRKAAEARAKKEKEALQVVEECFNMEWEEWEREEEEKVKAQKAEEWLAFTEANEELRETWVAFALGSNKAYERDRPLLEALQLVLRPRPPRKSDLVKALPRIRKHLLNVSESVKEAKARWLMVTGWVKDTERKKLSLSLSLKKAKEDFPWLLPEWFIYEEAGVSILNPLGELKSFSREQWVNRVMLDPVLSDEQKEKLFSLAGEE